MTRAVGLGIPFAPAFEFPTRLLVKHAEHTYLFPRIGHHRKKFDQFKYSAQNSFSSPTHHPIWIKEAKMSSNRVNTVGVVGGNGYVGAQIAQHLIKYAQDGKVKLVLFHRKGNPVKVAQDIKSENVESREFDLDGPLGNSSRRSKGSISACEAKIEIQSSPSFYHSTLCTPLNPRVLSSG